MLDIRQAELSVVPSEPVPQRPAPPAPKPVGVSLEEVQKLPEPMPQPEPAVMRPAEASESQVSSEAQAAQVVQLASAPGAQAEAAETLSGQGRTGEINWQSLAVAKLRGMIEREKYYPPSAQKAGYTGRFRVRIRLEPDGIISGYEIKERHGHPMLGKAVESALEKIKGRTLGMTLPERFDVLMPIEFELK